MSNEPVKGGSEYPGVSYSDALEYFQDILKNPQCELCQHEAWNISIQSDNHVPGLVNQETENFTSDGVLPLVILSCVNCGNLKFFFERQIHNYLRVKRLASAHEGSTDARHAD